MYILNELDSLLYSYIIYSCIFLSIPILKIIYNEFLGQNKNVSNVSTCFFFISKYYIILIHIITQTNCKCSFNF